MVFVYSIVFISIIIIDQITKYWAVSLKNNPPIVLIDNFLQLNYTENSGAAFGMLQGKQAFFIIVTSIILIIIIYTLKKNNNLNNISKLTLILISGGAVGNLIDRIRLHYVIDFIDVTFGKLYDFPIFNVADSFVVIGTFILIYLIGFDKFEKSEKNG